MITWLCALTILRLTPSLVYFEAYQNMRLSFLCQRQVLHSCACRQKLGAPYRYY